MTWHRSISGKIVILLTLVFAFNTVDKISKVQSDEKPCLSTYDGFGYYAYLPQLFENGDLKFERGWMQKKQDQYCYGAWINQLEKKDLEHEINIYHMGLSYILAPSYVLGDLSARIGDYPQDGFSKPYHITYLLNALLFIFLGLLYVRKLLLHFAEDKAVSTVLVLIALATNTYFIFNYQYDLPHLYLFTLNAASFYHFVRFVREKQMRSFWFGALLFGVAVCIRPTQLLFGLIPLILLYKEFGASKNLIKYLLFIGGTIVACNIPQLLYWKLVGGQWIILNLHTEDMVLSDPNFFNFLFSYRKGWLLYTPLFLLIPFGFYYLRKWGKYYFWAILSFVFLYIWAMSSWECWWYASSFGQRVMVDIYPILAIPLVLLIDNIRKRIIWGIVGVFGILCLVLNLFQSTQVTLGILDGHRMTKEHYWHIWGELNPEKIHHRFLLIDKGNRDWPNQLRAHENLPFTIKERNVYSLEDTLIAEPQGAVAIDKIHLLENFQTHETLLEIPIQFTTTDSTQSALLRMEAVSTYNCYSWDNIDLSLGRRQNEVNFDTLRFNLPDIRHANDSMQMYIMSLGNAQVTLLDFKIRATSLIRP